MNTFSAPLDHGSLRPEMQILLACSRTEVSVAQTGRLQALISGPMDWEEVLALGVFHRVVPLLHWNLDRLALLGVPDDVSENLATQFQKNQRRMEGLTEELVRLFGALEAVGIRALPVKGPSLAARLYGGVALRPAGDLDILVTKSDIPGALDVFRECGYRLKFGKSQPTSGQKAAVCRFLYDFHLVDDARGFSVELHFNLSPNRLPFRVSPEELLQGASSWTVNGRSIPVVNDEENLIYLCVHGGKHGWVLLEWVVGVCELLRKMEDVDEQNLWRIAERRGAGTALLLGISLAHQLLESNRTPLLAKQASEDRIAPKLVEDVVRRLGAKIVDAAAEDRFQRAICSSIWKELRWLFYTKLQPEKADIKFASFPVPALYYLIRPIRLARGRVVAMVR